MDALRLENRVIVADIALVVHLHEDVRPSAFYQPARGFIGRTKDSCLILNAFVLAEVKVADDRNHAEFVGAIEDSSEAPRVIGAQRAIHFERGIVPRLLTRIAFRGSTLEINRERQESVL